MKKLSIKPIIYTILILIAIITFTCGESKSKYIKEDGSAIKYSVYIKKMSGTPLNALPHGILAGSTYKEMKFLYTFNRSGNMLPSDTSETYEIIPRGTCSIIRIDTQNAIINGNLITFTNHSGNENIRVELNCDVEASIINDYINVTLDVNNYFNGISPKFAYSRGINNISTLEYYSLYPIPVNTDVFSSDYTLYTMKSDREEKIKGLNNWFVLFSEALEDSNTGIEHAQINNYVKFLTEETDITLDNIDKLNNYIGLNAAVNQNGDFEFNIDEKFLSAVKTHSEKYSKNLYFYDNVTDVDELFIEYLRYFNIYSETEISTIIDYMNANETTGETIIDLVNRLNLGMSYNDETKLLDGVEYLYNHIVYNVPTHKYPKANIFARKFATFRTNMNNVTVLTGTDLLNQILDTNNTRLRTLLSITDTSTMFDGYVYYESAIDNKKAIVHVYSYDEEYTYIDIKFVDSNVLIYEYNSVDIESIKSDLDYISTTFYNSSLTLLDTNPEVVNNYNTLENGTYNLNIGSITVTANKIITITLGDRSQNISNEIEETTTESSTQEETTVEDESTTQEGVVESE